jgi:hypothetical protein
MSSSRRALLNLGHGSIQHWLYDKRQRHQPADPRDGGDKM